MYASMPDSITLDSTANAGLFSNSKAFLSAIDAPWLPVLPGMGSVAMTIAEMVVKKLENNENVSAILAGKSDNVLHVWIMIREWTAVARKSVYSVQRELLKTLNEDLLDFYVIDLPDGITPQEMVSDMPVVFERCQCA